MKRLILIAGLLLALPSLRSHAADASATLIQSLCQSGIEGSAIGSIGSTNSVRMNLFCIDSERLAGSAYIDSMPNPTLTYSTAGNGILTLSQFPLTPDDRSGISASTSMTYVKLNIAKLQQGVVRGYFVNGNLTYPIPIKGRMDQKFPSVDKMVSAPIEHKDFIGVYSFILPDGQDVRLWADISNGVPLFNMFIKVPLGAGRFGGQALHFVDGPVWNGKSGFESTTSFGDTSTTGTPLWHIRGRVIAKGVLELYLIDPINGIRGPMIAKKIGDPWNYLEMP